MGIRIGQSPPANVDKPQTAPPPPPPKDGPMATICKLQFTIRKLQSEIDIMDECVSERGKTIKRLRGIIADMMSMRYMACENRHKDPGCGYCDACKFTTEVSCRAVAAAVPDPTT